MSKLTSFAARHIGNLGLRMPRLTARAADTCTSLACYLRLRLWCADNPCPAYPDRYAMYRAMASGALPERLDGAIDFLEFGTAAGDSLRAWLDLNRDPDSRFFDSFEGLPEDFRGLEQGTFSTGGETPAITDPRCHFVKGLFQATLPGFLADYSGDARRVVHLDADLYSSTLYLLFALAPWLRPGDLLLFDEFGIWEHEFRAWRDFATAVELPLRAVARTDNWRRVVFIVESHPPVPVAVANS